jgi:hypothetical protein
VQCNHVQKKKEKKKTFSWRHPEQRQHGELLIQLQYNKYQQKPFAVNTEFAESSFYEWILPSILQ